MAKMRAGTLRAAEVSDISPAQSARFLSWKIDRTGAFDGSCCTAQGLWHINDAGNQIAQRTGSLPVPAPGALPR